MSSGLEHAARSRCWRVPARVERLPELEPELVAPALGLLSRRGLRRVMRERVLPLPGPGGGRHCAVTDDMAAHVARQRGLLPVARVRASALLRALQDMAGMAVARAAADGLRRRMPHYSAARRLTCHQKVVAIAVTNLAILATWSSPTLALSVALGLAGLFFLLLAALRLAAAMHRAPARRATAPRVEELPTYTVLVPLFREGAVARRLVAALNALDYPAHKLDIKLLVEEVDAETRAALARMTLPDHFEVLTLPDGQPRTKPRALNFGLAFARGELLTIYDAEDIPDPGQLRHAAATFSTLPDEVACLQAPLAWYNADETPCSRMLAIEYAAHFDVMLPFLADMGAPLPLGGTSNHFRVHALRAAGGWDAHNVTEDADLGLRLARLGWRCGVLEETLTLEEACTDWRGWRHQRARWIKGWLQTWLVHMRAPGELLRACGWRGMLSLQAVMGAGVFAALAHPLFLAVVAADLLNPARHDTSWGDTLLCALSLTVLMTGYGASAIIGLIGLKRRGLTRLAPWLALLPLYWLAISTAAWLALWDFIRRPHHWRKTRHGTSRLPPPGGVDKIGAGTAALVRYKDARTSVESGWRARHREPAACIAAYSDEREQTQHLHRPARRQRTLRRVRRALRRRDADAADPATSTGL